MLKPCCSVSSDQRGFTLVELLVTTAIVGLIMAAVLSIQMSGAMTSQTSSNKAEAQQSARSAMMLEEELRVAGYGYPPSGSKIDSQPVGPCYPSGAAFIICAASPTSITFMADAVNATATLLGPPLYPAVNSGVKTFTVNDASQINAGNTIYLINGSQAASLIVKTVAGNNITVKTGVKCPGIPDPCYPAGAQVGRARTVTYSWNSTTLELSKDAGDGAGSLLAVTGVQAFQLRYFDANDAEILPANLNIATFPNIRRVMIDLTARSATALNQGTFRGISSVRPRNL